MLEKIKKIIERLMKDEEEKKEETYNFYEMHKDALNRDWTERVVIREEEKEAVRMETTKEERRRLLLKMPLETGDVLEMKDGRFYRVCKKTMRSVTSTYEVRLIWQNRPNNYQEKDAIEEMRLGSLRELNYYVEQEIDELNDIKKAHTAAKEPRLTMEEMHELALKENKRIDIFLEKEKKLQH